MSLSAVGPSRVLNRGPAASRTPRPRRVRGAPGASANRQGRGRTLGAQSNHASRFTVIVAGATTPLRPCRGVLRRCVRQGRVAVKPRPHHRRIEGAGLCADVRIGSSTMGPMRRGPPANSVGGDITADCRTPLAIAAAHSTSPPLENAPNRRPVTASRRNSGWAEGEPKRRGACSVTGPLEDLS
jgi:hypothetical protein